MNHQQERVQGAKRETQMQNQAVREQERKENEEFFTMSWGYVNDEPDVHHDRPAKFDKSIEKGINTGKMTSIPSAGTQKAPQIPQSVSNNFETNQKFISKIPQQSLFPSYENTQLFKSVTRKLHDEYAKKFSLSSNNQDYQNSYPANFSSSKIYDNNAPSIRNDYILKQPSQDRNENEQFRYLEHQKARVNEWSHEYINPNPNQIQLSVRSQLIRKPRKPKICTNNAHKKYINCLKNLFYHALSQQQIDDFEEKYIKQKSSRAFFFVILVYVKYHFTKQLAEAVKIGFQKQMQDRIKQYYHQVHKCSDFSQKNYRKQEINEINIALKAINEFYLGNTPQAIEYLYRKGKKIIVKQNHFRTSLKSIQELENQHSKFDGPRISTISPKEHYHKKLKQITDANSQMQNYNDRQFMSQKNHLEQNSKEQINENYREEQVSGSHEASSFGTNKPSSLQMNKRLGQNSQSSQKLQRTFAIDKMHDHGDSEYKRMANFFDNSRVTPKPYEQPLKRQRPQIKNMQKILEHRRLEEFAKKNEHNEILFPPIPPYFYSSDFDEKYGHLFRKLAYVNVWRAVNERKQRNLELTMKTNFNKSSIKATPPQPMELSKIDFKLKKQS